MSGTDTSKERLDRLRRYAVAAGVAGVAFAAYGATTNWEQFVRSYLLAFLFWCAMPIGGLTLLLIHHAGGGHWGFVSRRFLEAATRTMPVVALLFLPVLLNVRELYLWARPEVVAGDHLLEHKAPYLNVPFFAGRQLFYFAALLFLTWQANRLSAEQDRRRDLSLERSFRVLGGVGLGLVVLVMTFAAVDWVMSLDPHWFSTMFGLMLGVGQVLSALAFTIVLAAWLRDEPPLATALTRQHFHDLGNLLLTAVVVWTYLAFSQYLIIWSGNLREEIPWYLHRTAGGWQLLAVALMVFHFAVPFTVLLIRRAKQNAVPLALVAAGVLVCRVLDLHWIVAPNFWTHHFHAHWLDAAALVAVGGIWVAVFARQLRRWPLVPLFDAIKAEHGEDAHHG